MTIAIGIGANTSIFTAVNGVLLKSFSFPEAERLVVVTNVSKSLPDVGVSYPDYLDWRAEQRVFEDLCSRFPAGGVIAGIGEPERVFGRFVTASFFTTFRLQPQVGRFFSENEDKPGAEHVMVISDALWRRCFNADPAVVGRTINYNGGSWTIVGVLPANFDLYGHNNSNNDVFLPLVGTFGTESFVHDRSSHPCRVIARLRPGVTERQAEIEMNTIAARLAAQYPATNAGVSVEVHSLLHDFVAEDSKALLVTSAGAILVLLIACANVANLTLARASTREREIAVRLAVGGSRWQIVRLLLSESLLIACIGGALGVLLAFWAVEAFKAAGPRVIARIDEIGVNVPVLIFSAGTIFAATILFGLLPALKAARVNVEPALKSGARTSGGLARVRKTLIVSELTLALMLLISASLLVKSFWALTNVNPGFDPTHVQTFRLRLPDTKYDNPEAAIRVVKEVRRRIRELPGVLRVGITSGIPLGRSDEESYWLEGQPEPANQLQWPVALSFFIDEDLCRTIGIPLLAGRMLSERDTADAPPVVVVDEEFARIQFGGDLQTAIGQRLRFKGENEPWREIVGVVRHVTHYGLEEHARGEIYRPWLQVVSSPDRLNYHYLRAMDFAVKTAGDPNSYLSAIKAELRKVDNDLPLGNVATLQKLLSDSTATRRFNLGLISLFALLALILSAVGLYGVMSYGVNQRTTEIGIRMAIGAQPKDVLKLILREGFVLAVIGTLLGVGGALALTRLISSVLFHVSAVDPVIYLAAAALLLIVAITACFWPARRASAVQPLEALRYE